MKNNLIDAIKKLSIHDHICLIYSNKSEQFDVIVPFIRIGLEKNEKCLYIADDNTVEDVLRTIRTGEIDIDQAIKDGKFVITNKKETYLRYGYFDPDEMIQFLKESVDSAKKEGFSALRVTCEMTWALGNDPGTQRSIEYESKLNNVFHEIDCLAICQYNINLFKPEIIMGMINTHPFVIYESLICKNFYYIPPDKFLKSKETIDNVKLFLENIQKMESAKKKLEDSEMKYRNIVETSYEGIWIIDTSAKTTFVNSRMAQLLGYTPEEMIGKDLFYFVNKDIYIDTEKCLERRKQGIEDVHDFRFSRKDGTDLWVIISTNPLFDDKGQHIGTLKMITDITDRKLAIDKLQKSDEFNKRLIDSSNDCIKILGIDGSIVFMSKGGQKLLEIDDIKHYINNNWTNFWKGDDKERAIYTVETAAKGNVGRFQGYCPTITGKPKWWDVMITPLTDTNGKIINLLSISRDITDIKMIEEKLRKSEENLKRAQRVAHVGNWEWDLITGKITWSEETFHLHGIDPKQQEPVYKELLKYYHPEDLPNFERVIEDAIKNGTHYTVMYRIILPDSSIHYLEARGETIRDNKGDIIKLFGTLMDITEYVHMVNKLRDSENHFRTSVKNMLDPFGIYSAIHDSTGHIVDFKIEFVNDAACKSNMMTQEEQIGKHLYELSPGHNKTELFDEYCQVIKTGKSLRKESTIYEDVYKGKHTSRAFDISVSKLDDGFAATWRDVTERKNAEEKLNKAYKNLECSNKELEQFAYVASHDLQEPLRTIYGYTELLESNYKGKLDNDADDFITYITSGAKRAQQMINDLLTLSRITTRGKEFVPVNTERILKITFENLQSLINKNHAIITCDSIPTIIADDSQIIQLFQNLIDNAIKFRREETPKIHISCKRKNGEWIFSVRDNGIGIDKNQFKKLFIIFQRLHSREKYPGTGIGLAMCKKIVERHEGTIWIESEIGIGSTFYFTIPVRPTSKDIID